MNNSHVREPFRSLLSDIREATQTLANCGALGPLLKDGTRMPREIDAEVERLRADRIVLMEALDHIAAVATNEGLLRCANDALAKVRRMSDPTVSALEKQDLAQTIQDAIEDWFDTRAFARQYASEKWPREEKP